MRHAGLPAEESARAVPPVLPVPLRDGPHVLDEAKDELPDPLGTPVVKPLRHVAISNRFAALSLEDEDEQAEESGGSEGEADVELAGPDTLDWHGRAGPAATGGVRTALPPGRGLTARTLKDAVERHQVASAGAPASVPVGAGTTDDEGVKLAGRRRWLPAPACETMICRRHAAPCETHEGDVPYKGSLACEDVVRDQVACAGAPAGAPLEDELGGAAPSFDQSHPHLDNCYRVDGVFNADAGREDVQPIVTEIPRADSEVSEPSDHGSELSASQAEDPDLSLAMAELVRDARAAAALGPSRALTRRIARLRRAR